MLVCVVPTPPDVGVCGAYSTPRLVCMVTTPPRGWCVWCLFHPEVGVCNVCCIYRLNISECTLRLASVVPATQGVLSSVSAAGELPPQNQ